MCICKHSPWIAVQKPVNWYFYWRWGWI